VTLEGARQREFAQLVTDHVLGHEHRNVLLAVVHGDRQADQIGQDRGTTRPGLDRALVVARPSRVDLLEQVRVDERAFLDRTCHLLPLNAC
jgi:hypothetical protein